MDRVFSRVARLSSLALLLVLNGCVQEETSSDSPADEVSSCCCQAPSRDQLVACPNAEACCEDETSAALQVATEAGGQKGATVNVGDKAPTFEGVDENEKPFKSTDHVGKKIIVVYFYPADFTGGCTKQACSFRDDYEKLAGKNVMVVGVSGDSVKTHALFKKAEKLNFTLLADEKGDIAKKFGVPTGPGGTVKKEIDGQKLDLVRGVTAQRWTFVIGLNGNIIHKNTKVEAAKDSKQILEVIEKSK